MPAFGKGRLAPANSSISSAALTTGYRSSAGPSDTWKERSRSSNSEPGSSVSRKIRSTFGRRLVRPGTMIPICAAGSVPESAAPRPPLPGFPRRCRAASSAPARIRGAVALIRRIRPTRRKNRIAAASARRNPPGTTSQVSEGRRLSPDRRPRRAAALPRSNCSPRSAFEKRAPTMRKQPNLHWLRIGHPAAACKLGPGAKPLSPASLFREFAAANLPRAIPESPVPTPPVPEDRPAEYRKPPGLRPKSSHGCSTSA